MVKKEVLSNLIDTKKAAILRIILNSKDELYLKEIAEKSKVSVTSSFRILQEFVNMGIIHKRQWKTSKVYRKLENDKVSFLKELFHEEVDGVGEFVEKIRNITEIQQIILQGKNKKGKANLLLIGQNINTEPVEKASKEVNEKGFEITYLTLTEEQYQQMAKMGLYAGEKKKLK